MSNDLSHHRRGGKIKGCCAEHRECRLTRIDFAKFAGRYAVGDQAGKVLEKRLEVFAGDPFNLWRGVHRFPLHQARVVRVCRKEIEVPVYPGAQPITGRGIGGRWRIDDLAELAKEIFEDGAMEAALVAKVVVE